MNTASFHRWASMLVLLALLAGCKTGGIPTLDGERPDHMILVSIDTQPGTAEIRPLSAADADPALGRGMYRFAVDLHWTQDWFLKKWRNLRVNSRALPCTATYDEQQKSWTLSVQYAVSAPGYVSQVCSDEIATFTKPADLDWDRITGIPERVNLRAVLQPRPSDLPVAAPSVGHSHFIIMGENAADQSLSAVNVFIDTVPAAAEVLMNGKPVPRAGFVQEKGPYHFVVKCPGYVAKEFDVGVNPAADIRQRIELEPATP